MGLEWADLSFRIEERYGMAIDFDAFSETFPNRRPPDLTVEELCQFVNEKPLRSCLSCQYSLRDLPDQGTCPECGKAFAALVMTLDGLIELVADVAGERPATITGDTWMDKDLRFG